MECARPEEDLLLAQAGEGDSTQGRAQGLSVLHPHVRGQGEERGHRTHPGKGAKNSPSASRACLPAASGRAALEELSGPQQTHVSRNRSLEKQTLPPHQPLPARPP